VRWSGAGAAAAAAEGAGSLFFASLSPSATQHVATINDSAFADRWGVGFGPPRLTDVRAQAYVTGISVYFEYIFFHWTKEILFFLRNMFIWFFLADLFIWLYMEYYMWTYIVAVCRLKSERHII